MGEQATAGLSIFELIAREWTLDSEVIQTAFNRDETAAIFRMSCGKIALGTTKDAESPKIRTRMELDTGRTTIRARENPVAPLNTPALIVQAGLPVVRFGAQGFAAIDESGVLQQITAAGQVVTRLKAQTTPVTALCSADSGDVLAITRANDLSLISTADMAQTATYHLDHAVTCQAICPKEQTLAAWGDGVLSLIDLKGVSKIPLVADCPGEITEISWNATGTHLSCASHDKSLFIVSQITGSVQQVKGFPGPVRNTAFCNPDGALVASGAFRLAAWSGDDLPCNDQPGSPLSTGKPGFVVVNTIATHPARPLVASGYASGLIAIASIGAPEEMMLHQERDTEVTSLCWSGSGAHLAIGFASGKAAMVTFPEQMFK